MKMKNSSFQTLTLVFAALSCFASIAQLIVVLAR